MMRSRCKVVAFMSFAPALVLSGCSADPEAHDAFGVACSQDQRPYRGFCVQSDAATSMRAGGVVRADAGRQAPVFDASPSAPSGDPGSSGESERDAQSSSGCGGREPDEEVCNGRDDDCDGRTDEDFDPQNDADHCGACGRACTSGQTCCAGSCVDTALSSAHCGACANACGPGQGCCGALCRDLQADASHCGACGRACASGQSCCGGTCVDTATHAGHCGACGNACGSGLSCCGGTCYNLDSAQDHCGSCTIACGLLEHCCRGGCQLLSLGC